MYIILYYFYIAGTPCISEIYVQNRTDTAITFSWTVPAPGLSYNIQICPDNTLRCLPRVTCTDCSSYEGTGLFPNTNYTVTVDSFSLLSSGDCVSQGCTSNTATAQTGIILYSLVGCSIVIMYAILQQFSAMGQLTKL